MSKLRRSISILCLVSFSFVFLPSNPPVRAQSTSAPEAALAGYPADPPADIEWTEGFDEWSDVVAAFNHARERENQLLFSSLGEINFPSAASWRGMSDGEKALWLINEERIGRGLSPLQGLEANVSAVAQSYAEWLLANNAFDHDADGRSPWDRLDANEAIGACHDFLSIAENLYFTATTSPDDIPFVIEQSIYRMLYEDTGSLWGHRHAILWTPYTENSGAADREGFVGIGHAHGGFTNPYNGQFYENTDIIVMNFFDPCATWTGTTPVDTATPTPTATPTSTPVSSPTPTASPTLEPTPTQTPSGPIGTRLSFSLHLPLVMPEK
jgi:uncharacterized protein YkwD